MTATFVGSFQYHRLERERQSVKSRERSFHPETFHVFVHDLQKMDELDSISSLCTDGTALLKTSPCFGNWGRRQSWLLSWQRLPGALFKLVSVQSSYCGLPR